MVDERVRQTRDGKHINVHTRKGPLPMSTIPITRVRLHDGETILLRSAIAADAPQLLEHVHAILAEGEFALTTLEDFPMTEEQEAAWLQTHQDEVGKVVIVAESESQIIGLISFDAGERKRISHQGDLSMSVNRAWRSRGKAEPYSLR